MPLLTTGQTPTTTTVRGGSTPQATGTKLTTTVKAVTAVAQKIPRNNRNVMVVILDDVGAEKFQAYLSLTASPNSVVRIPNIKTHVILRGITFNKFWVCPVCGPTRSCAECGLYPHHSGHIANITDDPNTAAGNFYLGQDPADLNNREPQKIQTLAHAIRNGRPKNLYRLGKFGKNHMQQSDYYEWPCGGEGWSHFKGHMKNLDDHFSWVYVDEERDLETGAVTINSNSTITTYGPEKELEDMEDFLDDALAANQPFVMWWTPSVGHSAYQIPPVTPAIGGISTLSRDDWIAAFGGSYPAAGTDHDFPGSLDATEYAKRVMTQKHQIESADDVFGRVVTKLQANGQYDDTVFIVFCDNGTSTDVIEAPFDAAHGKRYVYSQGIQVPLFIAGPVCGQVPRTSNEMVNVVDIEATIRDICRVYPKALTDDVAAGGRPRDGVSILGHLRNPATPTPRTMNFTMIGGPYAGYGWNPATRIYTSLITQGSYSVSDGTHTLVRLGAATPVDKLFLASGVDAFGQPDSANLLVTAPTDPVTVAAAAKLRSALNTFLTT